MADEKDEKDVHVLGLTPREQFVLKLLLGNLMAGYLDKTVKEAAGYVDQTAIDFKASLVIGLFNKYNDFADLLCPESMLHIAKPKVITLKDLMMQYVVLAIQGYDPKQCYLGSSHIQIVNNSLEALKKKALESAEFKYSKNEINIAKNRK